MVLDEVPWVASPAVFSPIGIVFTLRAVTDQRFAGTRASVGVSTQTLDAIQAAKGPGVHVRAVTSVVGDASFVRMVQTPVVALAALEAGALFPVVGIKNTVRVLADRFRTLGVFRSFVLRRK